MPRLFLESLPDSSQPVRLDRENTHYLRNVLRCVPNDTVILFDGSGTEYVCTIEDIKKEALLSVAETLRSDVRPRKQIVLVQSVLKGQKMDMVVQKAGEIGVRDFIPVISERSQVRRVSKIDRWQKIASHASQQSRRTDILRIHDVVSFAIFLNETLKGYPETLKVVFSEHGDNTFRDLEERIQGAESVLIFVGPEGGFSRNEVDSLVEKGFHAVGLGRMILRAETASLITAGIIQYLVGQFE